ncbi:MAG: hypothetical protein WC832_02135 [Anaerolineales bacterium]
MTDPKTLNQTISEGQSAMYARQLEETIRAVKSELVVARQGLADVARVLCPDQVDVLTGKHPGSSAATLPLEELITTMKGVAQTLRLIAANSTKSPNSKEDKLLARVTELEGLLRAEKRRADLFERSKANAEQTLDAERSRAAKAARGRGQQGGGDRYAETASAPRQKTEPKEVSPETPAAHADTQTLNGIKDWEAWEADFELEEPAETKVLIKRIVEFVGKIGKTTIAEIAEGTELDPQMARRKAKYAAGMCSLLAEQETPLRSAGGGRPEKIYPLSPKGEWYFKRLTDQTPVTSKEEALIKSAKTGIHGGLISKVGARFKALGWEVDYSPKRIYFDNKTYSAPDLVIRKDTSTLYVEVETGEHIRTETADNWDTKFTNAYRASKGVLCVVTEARSQMTTMLGKINFWLVQKKMYPIFIYATTLFRLTEAQPDESPWEKAEQKASQA